MQDIVADGSLLLALLIAVLAGAVSFFSPCVLPLVPGYLAYLGGSADLAMTAHSGQGWRAVRGSAGGRRMLGGTLLFVLGFTAVFVGVFSVFGQLGAWVLRWETQIMQVFGALIIVLGLVFMGAFRPLQRSRKLRTKQASSLWGAPLLGAAFAIGWTPCMGPTLGVILSLSLQQGSAARGAALGVAYCLGLGLPFLLVAAGFGWVASMTGWVRRHMRQVNLFGGIMLVLIGVLMVSGLWTKMLYALQAWIGGFVTPI